MVSMLPRGRGFLLRYTLPESALRDERPSELLEREEIFRSLRLFGFPSVRSSENNIQ